MAKIMLVLPVLPGESENWRRFIQELQESRRLEHQAARVNMEIQQEMIWLVQLPQTELAVLYFETSHPERLRSWLLSERNDAAAEQAFAEQLRKLNGQDLARIWTGCQAELLMAWIAS
jgi:hypothetical protein